MSVNEGFLEFVVDQLSSFGTVRSRKMFGGAGIYLDELFIAIVDEDRIYLKADDGNREQYISHGFEAFKPYGDKGGSMSYYELPGDYLENREELGSWIAGAQAAAGNSKKRNQ